MSDVAVASETTPNVWQLTDDADLRVRANQSFHTSDGRFVPQGSYFRGDITVAGEVATFPPLTLSVTEDSTTNQRATYTAEICKRGTNKVLGVLLDRFSVPPEATQTTWAALTIHKNGKIARTTQDTYSTQAIEALIAIALGQLNLASVGVAGRIETSVPPADSGHPIAVGSNDRRVTESYNVKATAIGAIGDGTTNDRAALNTLVNTTLQITGAGGDVYLPAGDYSIQSNMTFPANVRLVFDARARLKPANGVTITILGPLEFTFNQIFTNANPGQGTISFVANTRLGSIVPHWWGVTGDGTTDDTQPFKAAIAQDGRSVFVPAGRYKISQNLAPSCGSIVGDGRYTTIFAPTAAVTRLFTFVNSEIVLPTLPSDTPTIVSSFYIDGSATTNAVGMKFTGSDVATTNIQGWVGIVHNVVVEYFAGASGIAVWAANIQKSMFSNCRFSNSTIGMLVEGDNQTYPDQVWFVGCQFTLNTTKGVKQVSGTVVSFWACLFESNAEEGVILLPDAGGTISDTQFLNGCWFENNYGATSTEYQFVADASAGGGNTCRFVMRDAYFHISGTAAAKSIKTTEAGVAGFYLSNVQIPNVMATIRNENGAYGTLEAFPPNLVLSDVVSDPDSNLKGASYGQILFGSTPSPSTNPNTLDDYEEGTSTPTIILGGGSVTYTLQRLTYTKIGRLVTVQILITVNVATTPSGSLEIGGLPFTASANQKGAVSVVGKVLEATAVTPFIGEVTAASDHIRLYRIAAGALVDPGADIKNGTILQITASYEVEV